MLYYFFGSKTGCRFFTWFQKKLKFKNIVELKATKRSPTIVTFIELILILWTFYLLLLFAYDSNFLGDRHPITYIIAFASLFWSLVLFLRLIKIKQLTYAIKYAIPTVVIFWNFVEILGRWDFFKEIWVEPSKYWLEMTLILVVFVALLIFGLVNNKKKKQLSK